ncbi:hypothetical protein [Prochlorococcus sp. MIT 1011]|uniref:capsular polysaccharide export protein, LipB/KpsS family n=1 Tax=Prochlorococcus sp. MIT 1011 TaxID=3082520 RepID=UPI0039B69897
MKNVLYLTQSSCLNMFYELDKRLRKENNIKASGFTISDSQFYEAWKERTGFIESDFYIIKEWELTKSPFLSLDMETLVEIEKKYSKTDLVCGSYVSDRRLYMGKLCAYKQDYKHRFKGEELDWITYKAITAMEKIFDDLKPELVIGFICVTFLDYIGHMIAKKRGIKYVNMRACRIRNRIHFGSSINDPSPELKREYITTNKLKDSDLEDYRNYISSLENINCKYEGVVSPSDKPVALRQNDKKYSLKRIFKNLIKYHFTDIKRDNHTIDPIIGYFMSYIYQPLNAKLLSLFYKRRYVLIEKVKKKKKIVFYALHTEPEVTILVYGRPFINQIELIRIIAISLPFDCCLIVKEHPCMIGKRSLNYYKKIVDIPNVYLASPILSPKEIIKESELVITNSGSAGFDGIIMKKPVITFGDCSYNILPDNMVRQCMDIKKLHLLITEIIQSYKYSQEDILRLIKAQFNTSIGINLYSTLLGRRNAFKYELTDFNSEIDKLKTKITSIMQD